VFWVVKLMDLGIVVPAALTTGVGLLRGLAWARKTMYALVGWLALLGSAVAAMGITMLVRDDPDASVALTSGFAAAALGLIALALALYRSSSLSRRGSDARVGARDGQTPAPTTCQVSTSPFPFTCTRPRGSTTNSSRTSSQVERVIWIEPGTPCDSMRLAMFTVSPHRS
jgi:hypothetical protein